ncbi:hypothetical protein M406DRAFT_44423 [Cryphonectria parasitica EP155]|uniref:Septin-type G domain-containing protein n=1 Tax=Cryphonectria parasitica (strain ATCC 38755 / EP155) TaxID=660469 RepID=A0A9P4Y7Q8_CRYP1|nr:uncharacterized protein M406DRAFT_44423 [Cryphonectria parasitica EP155]KAF3768472.1 hypothetical protein M406DRAFT_44423 [Cryphonectria parasitica EP155]
MDQQPRAISTDIPVPPIPTGHWVDPYARTESMTNRGRYSYASSAISTVNNPRRVRRRKDPTPFNVLIIGTRGSGKTSFLEFLKTALALPPHKRGTRMDPEDERVRATPSGNFIPHYLESEIDGERVGLTLWDSEGLEKNVVDLQLREMSTFVESKFEETFAEEMKVIRSPGVQDTHIHCAFILLDPARLDKNISSARALATNGNAKYHAHSRIVGSLDDDLDLQVFRTLQGKTTVIPVVAKADTITSKHMNVLKKSVWDSLKQANMDPLEVLGLEDGEDEESRPSSTQIAEEPEAQDSDYASGEEGGNDDELPIQAGEASPQSKSSKRQSIASARRNRGDEGQQEEIPYIPLSIISPDIYEPEVIGRKFPWGFADPNNEEHCDFLRLKEAVFSDWRAELREASRDQWYEGWRTSRLKQRDGPVRRR